jgi:hypothetical protein
MKTCGILLLLFSLSLGTWIAVDALQTMQRRVNDTGEATQSLLDHTNLGTTFDMAAPNHDEDEDRFDGLLVIVAVVLFIASIGVISAGKTHHAAKGGR